MARRLRNKMGMDFMTAEYQSGLEAQAFIREVWFCGEP